MWIQPQPTKFIFNHLSADSNRGPAKSSGDKCPLRLSDSPTRACAEWKAFLEPLVNIGCTVTDTGQLALSPVSAARLSAVTSWGREEGPAWPSTSHTWHRMGPACVRRQLLTALSRDGNTLQCQATSIDISHQWCQPPRGQKKRRTAHITLCCPHRRIILNTTQLANIGSSATVQHAGQEVCGTIMIDFNEFHNKGVFKYLHHFLADKNLRHRLGEEGGLSASPWDKERGEAGGAGA